MRKMRREWMVSHKIVVIYTHKILARTKKEAERTAEDLGDYRASDQATETKWRARETS